MVLRLGVSTVVGVALLASEPVELGPYRASPEAERLAEHEACWPPTMCAVVLSTFIVPF